MKHDEWYDIMLWVVARENLSVMCQKRVLIPLVKSAVAATSKESTPIPVGIVIVLTCCLSYSEINASLSLTLSNLNRSPANRTNSIQTQPLINTLLMKPVPMRTWQALPSLSNFKIIQANRTRTHFLW